MATNKNNTNLHHQVDYEALLHNAPSLHLVLLPDFTIVEVSESYAEATMTSRNTILGKKLFDIFPDNPDDTSADGVSNLNASLQYVLKNKLPHSMAIQKYDIRNLEGNFEERYWSPYNKPVLNDNKEVLYIIHKVEDVTEIVTAQKIEFTHTVSQHQTAPNGKDLLASIIDTSEDAIFSIDLNGIITSWNKASEKIFGYTAAEIIKQSIESITPDNLRVKEQLLLEIIKNGEIVEHYETVRIRKDNTPITVSITISPIKDSSGTIVGFSKISRNITRKKKIVDQIKKAEKNYRELFDKSSDGIYVRDIENGNYIEINQRAIEIRGYTKDELLIIPTNVSITDDPNYSSEKAAEYFQKAAKGEPQHFEWLSKKKDGSTTWYEVNLKRATIAGKDRVLVFFHEINDRKQTEQKLIASEERFRSIIEQFPFPIIRYSPDGLFQLSNKALGLMWHDSLKGLEDYNILKDKQLMDSDIGKIIKKAFNGKFAISEPFLYDPKLLGRTGRKRWMVMSIYPLKNEFGEILEVIAIQQDVTEMKLAEEEIKKSLKLTLMQKKQLEDFCNIVSHNLRAPLVNISMLVDFVIDSKDPLEQKIFHEKLSIATDNLNEIFNQLIESLQVREDTEMNSDAIFVEEYLHKVIAILQGQIDQTNATIELDIQCTHFYFPEKYFVSIVQNLLSNSLKYKSPDRNPVIQIKTYSKNDYFILEVTDNGLGIDLEKHKNDLFKIRKIFHALPDAKGFGLFITKSQVEAMGGEIWVESSPNKGATFFVKLKTNKHE